MDPASDRQASQLGPVTLTSLHCSGDNISGVMTLDGEFGDVSVRYAGSCTPYVAGIALVRCHTP